LAQEFWLWANRLKTEPDLRSLSEEHRCHVGRDAAYDDFGNLCAGRSDAVDDFPRGLR